MRKGDQTRQVILDEAIAEASKSGLGSLTIGKLAARVRMSKSGLFAHFTSKENLQVEVLKAAAIKFIGGVITPALAAPRGQPRILALFENWLKWSNSHTVPGGCLFVSSSIELHHRPGTPRDFLVKNQKDWLDFISNAARIAIAEEHFRADADTDQFAYEFHSILLAYQFSGRLMQDANADKRARIALNSLLSRVKA